MLLMEDDELSEMIRQASLGLIYISEIDAEITPFVAPENVASERDLMLLLGKGEGVEVRDYEELSRRLSTVREWHTDVQIERAKAFEKLFALLRENLRQIKVYRVGTTRLEILVLGRNASDRIIGIRTEAVET